MTDISSFISKASQGFASPARAGRAGRWSLGAGGASLAGNILLTAPLSETPSSYNFSLISIRYRRQQCSVCRGSSVTEAGIAWRVSPQGVDDIGVLQPHRPGRTQSVRASPESKVRSLGSPLKPPRWATAALGRAQRSRRNAVAADGVRLVEAPVTPSWGEVHIRIPSRHHGFQGLRGYQRRRDALSGTHLSGDLKSLHVPNLRPGWSAQTAIGRMRTSTALAECSTTGLIGQAGGDSGSRVAESGRQSRLGKSASWKDPL
jgi:hypothetical protein